MYPSWAVYRDDGSRDTKTATSIKWPGYRGSHRWPPTVRRSRVYGMELIVAEHPQRGDSHNSKSPLYLF
jgi:hypothetical protein